MGGVTYNSIASSNQNICHIRYKGYYYDEESNLYYCKTRYYNPYWGRFISYDSVDYLDPSSINGINLYAYCNNNPVMYADPSGHFPILACILGITALLGLGLTIGGVASNNNILTAVGLGITGIASLCAGCFAIGIAFSTGAIMNGVVGGATILAGIGTLGFMSAEIQEEISNDNWIRDATGISEEAYKWLLIGTAALAAICSIASFIMIATNPMTGFTNHGLVQALGRDGGYGVSRKAILNAVKHPLKVIDNGARGMRYLGKLATVVLNSSGKVITTWATTSAGRRFLILLCIILSLVNSKDKF